MTRRQLTVFARQPAYADLPLRRVHGPGADARAERHVAGVNPVDRAMTAGRSALSADPDRGTVLARGGGLSVLAAAAVWLSIRTVGAYQRSV